MLNKSKALQGYKLECLDGEMGKVKDFYFDDRHWVIRYLIVETGHWLAERQVLISPYAVDAVLEKDKCIKVNLTKKQIENSPSLDSDKPVSRQFEEAYHGYYGWPIYWSGAYMWGPCPYPPHVMRGRENWREFTQGEPAWDPYLRSTRTVRGNHIQTAEGQLGHIEDFIIDDETWAIRYLIIDTRNWWPGKSVLISPRWIDGISWVESKVFVKISREAIKLSPEYTEESVLSRDYEVGLHQHYNYQGYWVDELATKDH